MGSDRRSGCSIPDLVSEAASEDLPSDAGTTALIGSSKLNRKRQVLGLGFLAGLSLALRLWGIAGHGLWHDEALELERASAPIASTIFGRPIDQDPPIFALMLRAVNILATGQTAGLFPRALDDLGPIFFYRALMAIFSAGGVILFWGWAAYYLGTRRAWLAAGLMSLAPVHVFFGQEINQYSMIVLAGLALLLAWEARHEGSTLDESGEAIPGRGKGWLRLAILSGLALQFHYGLAFLIAIMLYDIAMEARRSRPGMGFFSWVRTTISRAPSLIAACAISTLFAIGLGLPGRIATPHVDQRLFGTSVQKELRYLSDRLWREFLVFVDFPFSGGWVVWFAGILALVAGFGLWRLRRRPKAYTGIVIMGLIGPLIAMYPADIWGIYPMGQRWLLFLSPAYYALLVYGALEIGVKKDLPREKDSGIAQTPPLRGKGAGLRSSLGLGLLTVVAGSFLYMLPQHVEQRSNMSLAREAMPFALQEVLKPEALGSGYQNDYQEASDEETVKSGQGVDSEAPRGSEDEFLLVSHGGRPSFEYYIRSDPALSQLSSAIGPDIDLPDRDVELAKIVPVPKGQPGAPERLCLLLARQEVGEAEWLLGWLDARGYALQVRPAGDGMNLACEFD